MLYRFGKKTRNMQEVRRDERGFTLIELLVVVIIIGVLAAIAIPVYLDQRQQSFVAECRSDTRNAVAAAHAYASDNDGVYTNMNIGNGGANDLAASYGFHQSPNTTTTVQSADADSFTLSSDCQGNVGTVTYDSDVGSVTGP